MKKHNAYLGLWDLTTVGPDGKIKDQQLGLRNGLSDDGECLVLSHFFQNTVTIPSFKLRLGSTNILASDHYSVVSSAGHVVSLPSTGVSAPPSFTSDGTGWSIALNPSTGNWTVTSAQASITAVSGPVGPFQSMMMTCTPSWTTSPAGWLSTENTEALVAFLNFPSRTLLTGNTLLVQINTTLQ